MNARLMSLEPYRLYGVDGYFIRYIADGEDFKIILATIKEIPYPSREWVPNAPGGKCWWIAATKILKLRVHFPNIESFIKQEPPRGRQSSYRAPNAVPSHVQDAFTALHLLPTAPEHVASACYRAMAKVIHPDAGGDITQMKRVNNAYDAVREWYKRGERVA